MGERGRILECGYLAVRDGVCARERKRRERDRERQRERQREIG